MFKLRIVQANYGDCFILEYHERAQHLAREYAGRAALSADRRWSAQRLF